MAEGGRGGGCKEGGGGGGVRKVGATSMKRNKGPLYSHFVVCSLVYWNL